MCGGGSSQNWQWICRDECKWLDDEVLLAMLQGGGCEKQLQHARCISNNCSVGRGEFEFFDKRDIWSFRGGISNAYSWRVNDFEECPTKCIVQNMVKCRYIYDQQNLRRFSGKVIGSSAVRLGTWQRAY